MILYKEVNVWIFLICKCTNTSPKISDSNTADLAFSGQKNRYAGTVGGCLMESVVIPFCCLEEARVAARCYGITLQSTPSK